MKVQCLARRAASVGTWWLALRTRSCSAVCNLCCSSSLEKCEQRLHGQMLKATTGHTSTVGSCPSMPNRERRKIMGRRSQGGTNCHKKGVPHARGDKYGNKVLRWTRREKMLVSQSTGLAHVLCSSRCLPHAACLPRQKPPKESSSIHSSPFPSWENISGLGPKSPVFEGKKKMGHICSYQR